MRFFRKHNIIILLIVIILAGIISAIVSIVNKNATQATELANAEAKRLSMEVKLFEVEEQIVNVAKDNSLDKAIENEKKEEVTFDGKIVAVPKSTVAAVNSKEDALRNRKTGGSQVSQNEVMQMFQNEGTHSNGIDVSAYQGIIDWPTVAANGVDFAIIRCGFRGYSNGGIYEDAYFKTNVAGATAAGVKVGIYFYSAAINENEALEEAVWVVQKISPYRITYPVVFDFEEFGSHRCSNVDGALGTKMAQVFLNYVSSSGYEPMLYANKYDIRNNFNKSAFSCKFWLAHYTSKNADGTYNKTDYNGSYNMWQYTSQGSVPGISGNVDMNVAYFSYGSVADPKHVCNFTEIVSKVDATCAKEGSIVRRCSCGEISDPEVLPKTDNHKWSDWKVDKENSCETRTCSLCKKTDTREIQNTNVVNTTNTTNTTNIVNTTISNNTISNTTNNTVNNTTNTLAENTTTNTTVTNTTNPQEETNHTHNWSEGTVTKDPTCTEKGEKEFTCSGCIEIKHEDIPALGHNYGPDGKCTRCEAINPDI